jgi:hypothetical protein
MLTKEQAEAAGAELLAKMKGEGWKLIVHENLGWHYRVVRPPLQVYRSYGGLGGYHVLMGSSSNETYGGLAVWATEQRAFDDPNEAVAAQLETARLQSAIDAADPESTRYVVHLVRRHLDQDNYPAEEEVGEIAFLGEDALERAKVALETKCQSWSRNKDDYHFGWVSPPDPESVYEYSGIDYLLQRGEERKRKRAEAELKKRVYATRPRQPPEKSLGYLYRTG